MRTVVWGDDARVDGHDSVRHAALFAASRAVRLARGRRLCGRSRGRAAGGGFAPRTSPGCCRSPMRSEAGHARGRLMQQLPDGRGDGLSRSVRGRGARGAPDGVAIAGRSTTPAPRRQVVRVSGTAGRVGRWTGLWNTALRSSHAFHSTDGPDVRRLQGVVAGLTFTNLDSGGLDRDRSAAGAIVRKRVPGCTYVRQSVRRRDCARDRAGAGAVLELGPDGGLSARIDEPCRNGGPRCCARTVREESQPSVDGSQGCTRPASRRLGTGFFARDGAERRLTTYAYPAREVWPSAAPR